MIPRRRRRSPSVLADRRTVGLGVLAVVATAGAVAVEVSRVWRRGSAPMLAEADDPFGAAAEAVVETAEVARTGYREASTGENSMFNLLSAFVTTFVVARSITTLLRRRRTFGPFRNLKVGRRHIHHFVPGITIAFVSGAAAIVTRDENVERWLAIPFGAGMGLTMDESALLLELDDVYWSEEGVVSVQITMAVTALLAAIALASRFLRRGEQMVLDSDDG
ncbi:MAG: hypothetical protein M3481_11375 [Actinomycetota bacterium]|nr:hypothetical protein [Actinomycetota bacterium]